MSFPDKKQMAAHKKFLEEAAKRDHRLIGKQQELFYFDESSPGSAMWLPHGMRIHNAITDYIKEEYWNRGYDEVMTPNMFNVSLWEQSGHLAHYKEDMFLLDVDKEQFGLKPMNCPGTSRSELPTQHRLTGGFSTRDDVPSQGKPSLSFCEHVGRLTDMSARNGVTRSCRCVLQTSASSTATRPVAP